MELPFVRGVIILLCWYRPELVDKKLLDILICPVSGAPLTPLTPEQRDILNTRVETQTLYYVDGSPVETPLEDGLITTDQRVVYRVDDDIPVLLPERGIPFEEQAANGG